VIADADGDGLPDWWELEFLGKLGNNASGLAPNGDGLSLIANYLQCINPNDYYGGFLPNIQIVSGDDQNGPAGALLPLPLTVQITAASGGSPLANAPVTFTAASGGGQLAASPSGALATTIPAITDANGMASVYFQPGGNATSPTANQVQASVATGGQTASQTFSILGTPAGAPPAAANLTVTSTSPTSSQLNWINTATGSTNAATGILVQQQNADGTWTTIATLAPGATGYEAPGLTTGQTYSYRVVAVNAAGGSSTPNPPSTAGDQYSAGNSSPPGSPGSPGPSAAPKPAPRYAVIDLKEGNFPLKITNSGYVFEILNVTSDVPQYGVWYNGKATTVQLPSTDAAPTCYPTDIGEGGILVGPAYVGTGSNLIQKLAEWDSSQSTPYLSAAPISAGAHTATSPPQYSFYSGLPRISKNYTWTCMIQTSAPSSFSDGYKNDTQLGTLSWTTSGTGQKIVTGTQFLPELVNTSDQYVSMTFQFGVGPVKYYFNNAQLPSVITYPMGLSNQSAGSKSTFIVGMGTGGNNLFWTSAAPTKTFPIPSSDTPVAVNARTLNCDQSGNVILVSGFKTAPNSNPQNLVMDQSGNLLLSQPTTPTAKDAQQILVGGAPTYLVELNPNTRKFGNPLALNDLIYQGTNGVWSNVTGTSLNDSGAIVGTADLQEKNGPSQNRFSKRMSG
jgi:hypothetical protein